MRNRNVSYLTPERQKRICDFITAGGFPHVAAVAAGLSAEKFDFYMARGASPKSDKKFVSFYKAVQSAKATARLTAEIAVMKDDPLEWLKAGPGKEKDGLEGWTTHVRPMVNHTNQTVNMMLHPQMAGIFGAILQVLAPFPDARKAVSEALARLPDQNGITPEKPRRHLIDAVTPTPTSQYSEKLPERIETEQEKKGE